MSRHFDDTTAASDPGRIQLSHARLKAFKSQLWLLDRLFLSGRKPDTLFEEHLMMADSRAAIVVSVEPELLIAAYSDDLDAVALLRFHRPFITQHRLAPGSKLLTVNSYRHKPSYAKPNDIVAPDLIAGPNYRTWYNFHPLIADFLAESPHQVEWKKSQIEDDEFARAFELASDYTARFPGRARNGNPYLSALPA